jgi:hypothetical protein
MKNDYDKGSPACPTCGKKMQPTTTTLAGQKVRAWKSECGEEIIHPQDAQKALTANKLKLGIKLRIGELNKAPYVRFTKDFSELLRKGGEAIVSQVSPNEIRIKIAE